MSYSSVVISPFGGNLVDLLAEAESPEELKRYAGGLPSV